MDQVGAMYKISEILIKAFKEVNDVCAHYLADQTLANTSKQQKPVEKKQIADKPHVNPVSKNESQPKKDHKPEVNQQKPKTQPVPQSPRPTQQSKPKQVQKQQPQTQSKQDKKKEAHPDKPKQPLSAFFLFTQDQKENVQKLHPKAALTELTKMMGEIWRGLDESEKAPFIEKAEQLKVQYNKKLQKFYEKHPEQKSKKQLKKEKRESKQQEEEQQSSSPVPVQKTPAVKPKKHIVVVEQQDNSESV